MELNELYELAREFETAGAKHYEEVCQRIYDYAELGEQEFQSSAYLKEQLEALGFTVTAPIGGLPTAFRAEFTPEELKAMGLTEGLIRISVGTEEIEDIIGDITNALKVFD